MRAEFKGLTRAELFNVGELVATFGIPSNKGLHPSFDCRLKTIIPHSCNAQGASRSANRKIFHLLEYGAFG
jgi:hypothetical protein